ncbi:isochorismate synthase [Marinifilum caeruleilacunae]|uniref:isochorismate synthase n=1 Tax=Marinifilum caeruleilacunae TaxID=2499076 RepID=A0ABX1WSB6_9BACT|nr:isochorismate synthase [Marinifilum caeruleilacunae]NOU58993.1 isochorismate synthase [Marinifilum caeruleilacunae]
MSIIEGEDIDIHDFLNVCLGKDIAFYAFTRPDSNTLEFGAQIEGETEKYDELKECFAKSGFVFAPFHANEKYQSHFIRREISKINQESLQLIKSKADIALQNHDDLHISSREEYQAQIEFMLADLKGEKLEKAILSRIELLENKGRKDAVSSFLNLRDTYPKAFVFMVDIPKVGLWIGATPERLVRKCESTFETMALAGTQKLDGRKLENISWEQKEIDEQAYVVEYIQSVFDKYQLKDVETDGPRTAAAGNIVHLKTLFKTRAEINNQELSNFVKDLHPTPAVCGLSKDLALDLIHRVENHDREYYAGYLGPIEENGDLSLFVNLRSMKVLENSMALFVGGGITADSLPEKEWMETCFKAQTLLNVIK